MSSDPAKAAKWLGVVAKINDILADARDDWVECPSELSSVESGCSSEISYDIEPEDLKFHWRAFDEEGRQIFDYNGKEIAIPVRGRIIREGKAWDSVDTDDYAMPSAEGGYRPHYCYRDAIQTMRKAMEAPHDVSQDELLMRIAQLARTVGELAEHCAGESLFTYPLGDSFGDFMRGMDSQKVSKMEE